MTVPKLHTFSEALAHLDAGGAIYRYGTTYPTYVNTGDGPQTRVSGGSSGELIKWGWEFTPDEQHSITWVLISKEEQVERDKRYIEAAQECHRQNMENAAKYLREQKAANQPTPTKRGWWQNLIQA